MRKKTLFISESQGWSGGARQMLALADGLRCENWDVTVACPGDGQTFQKAKAQGLDVIDFFPRQDYDVLAALRLTRLMAQRGTQVLHAHHPRAHAVGLMAAYLSGQSPTFVVTRRVSFPPSRNIFAKFKYCSSRIDGYIAVAESIRSILMEVGVAPDKVTTIPSGVDVGLFAPRPKDAALAREFNLPAKTPVIGLVANYSSWKGQDIFLKAAGELKSRGVPAVYLLAGRDTQHPDLKKMAVVAGLSDEDVRWIGFFEDAPRLLSLLDVSVNASTAGEGISGAIRESLAMGIPVVASDIGGNREIVEDGVTGKLFKAGDASALAQALRDVLSGLPQARRMAEVGQRKVLDSFSVEHMVSATAKFYDQLLACRSLVPRESFQYVC